MKKIMCQYMLKQLSVLIHSIMGNASKEEEEETYARKWIP